MTIQTDGPATDLYDVLDVEPTATAEEIRAAWRSAVADLDPTDRRFRVYNRAAEVLLDPARRTSYDADVAGLDLRPDPLPAATVEGAPEPTVPTRRTRRAVPGWLVVALAGLTAVLLGYVGVALATPSGAAVRSDTEAAQAAAEKAIVPILSYDAHSLDRSEARATARMTSSEQAQYRKLFAVIRQNAPRTATVVRAQYVASGVVRTGTDQVDVLVFVNQRTTNRAHPKVPVIYKSQVTVSMVEVGGQWLVDGLHTTGDGS